VRLHTRLFVLALAMGVLVIGAIAWPMWQGRVYVADDLGIFHLAARAFYARSLAQGDSFLWWPDVLCGYYLHGEGQAGLYHPLHLLLYRTLPLATAFTLELVLHYPFLLAGTFLVLRRWGFERAAAMFGALVFTFSSFNFLHFVHPNIVAVIAHVPWLLLAIDVVLCDSDARRVAFAKVAVGLLTASQLLVGHPQAVWLSAVIELLYVLFRRGAWSGPGRLWSLAASISFGILGGMIQLLPTWDAMSESVRAAPGTLAAYRAFDSMKPVNLVQLVGPYLLKARVSGRSTQDYALYTGATASVLWIWLLMRRRQLGLLKPLASGVIALTVIGLLLAFGKYGYVYRLQAYIPLVNSFGVPVRYVVLVQFAFAVGAALAFADLARVGERQAAAAWRELWPLAAVGAVSVALAGAALVVRAQSGRFPDLAAQIASPAAIGLGAGLVVVAAALAIAAARGSRAALAGLIVFRGRRPGGVRVELHSTSVPAGAHRRRGQRSGAAARRGSVARAVDQQFPHDGRFQAGRRLRGVSPAAAAGRTGAGPPRDRRRPLDSGASAVGGGAGGAEARRGTHRRHAGHLRRRRRPLDMGARAGAVAAHQAAHARRGQRLADA
jgi:hypothetical protein